MVFCACSVEVKSQRVFVIVFIDTKIHEKTFKACQGSSFIRESVHNTWAHFSILPHFSSRIYILFPQLTFRVLSQPDYKSLDDHDVFGVFFVVSYRKTVLNNFQALQKTLGLPLLIKTGMYSGIKILVV